MSWVGGKTNFFRESGGVSHHSRCFLVRAVPSFLCLREPGVESPVRVPLVAVEVLVEPDSRSPSLLAGLLTSKNRPRGLPSTVASFRGGVWTRIASCGGGGGVS